MDLVIQKHFDLRIILGSSSHARQSILKNSQLPYEIIKSDFEENLDKSEFKTPEEYCQETCLQKSLDIQRKIQDQNYDLLITADTIVLDDKHKILEKPINKEQNKEFLKSFSNSYCEVITTMILTSKKDSQTKQIIDLQKAKVFWNKIDDKFIDFIVDFDKTLSCCSGGFKIECLLGAYINRIEGDPQIVTGLSIKRLFNCWA